MNRHGLGSWISSGDGRKTSLRKPNEKNEMNSPKALALQSIYLLAAVFAPCAAHAHGDAPWGGQPLPWTNRQIDRAIVVYGNGQVLSAGGRRCLTGQNLAFDVLDTYAFDIDETVWVDVELYDPPAGAEVQLTYDRADHAPQGSASLRSSGSESSHTHRQSFALVHARFANLGFNGTDLALHMLHGEGAPTSAITICAISIRRSYATPMARAAGELAIEVVDENARPTPARMGIYDRQGRLPLPSSDATTLQSLNGLGRVIQFPIFEGNALAPVPPWPADNRSVFYVNGVYRATLPAGDYDLVAAKGLEYRISRRHFTIAANELRTMKIKLQRWHDLAKSGWISGDDHIHYALESAQDDRALRIFTQAEDLKVANILQMGNAARTYFPQHTWEPITNADDDRFVLVPGQEDPRTSRRGHTISLDIREPVRDPSHYPLYHEVFDKVHAQGGLAGYAHVTDFQRSLHAVSGMAVDVPFGAIDFAEILSGPSVGGPDWFDFLNLGYKLSPTAGTDYLFGLLPGAVRTYVKLDRPFTPQAWFDALKNGHTFVTNGPVLDFSINGEGVGSEISLERDETLRIKGSASLNPDFGALASVDLIEQGNVVKRVLRHRDAPINLDYKVNAKHSTWYVLKARGAKENVVALSAPIYVSVDGQPFWKQSEVSSIVARLKASMAIMLASEVPEDDNEELESTKPLAEVWHTNEGMLKARVDQANAKLEELMKRAAGSSDSP
jgi:hypothetical protein